MERIKREKKEEERGKRKEKVQVRKAVSWEREQDET